MAPARTFAGGLEAPVTHICHICHPLGASGHPCLAIFPIFSILSANFLQKNSLQATYHPKKSSFPDLPCSRTPKIIENQWKTIAFFDDFDDVTFFIFSACWHQFWKFCYAFEWIWPLKWSWRLSFAFPWPLLGPSEDNFQLPWGDLETYRSSFFDGVPCLGNIFCDFGPPRRLPR